MSWNTSSHVRCIEDGFSVYFARENAYGAIKMCCLIYVLMPSGIYMISICSVVFFPTCLKPMLCSVRDIWISNSIHYTYYVEMPVTCAYVVMLLVMTIQSLSSCNDSSTPVLAVVSYTDRLSQVSSTVSCIAACCIVNRSSSSCHWLCLTSIGSICGSFSILSSVSIMTRVPYKRCCGKPVWCTGSPLRVSFHVRLKKFVYVYMYIYIYSDGSTGGPRTFHF